jgi:hypothetical protein
MYLARKVLAAVAIAVSLLALQACAGGSAPEQDDPSQYKYPYSGSNW